MAEGLKIKGMFHIQITEDGKVVGDSGWRENVVTNLGFNQYLVSLIGGIAGSKQVTHMALGTGTQPGAADTSLEGEVTSRASISAATQSGSKTCRFTATFASVDSFVGATVTLKNIGLIYSSNNETLFCGNTYDTSTCATNQNVNATYDIIFS